MFSYDQVGRAPRRREGRRPGREGRAAVWARLGMGPAGAVAGRDPGVADLGAVANLGTVAILRCPEMGSGIPAPNSPTAAPDVISGR